MNPIMIAATVLLATACTVLPAPLTGQATDEAPPRTIQVNGNASVQRTPDQAVVQLAVETVAATAEQASEENARTMQQVLEAIRGAGVPGEDIQSSRVALQPRYDRRPDQPAPEIVGYQAVNEVVVTLDDVTAVGEVVDAAVGAGANRVRGINFQLQDPESAYREALRLAVENARREAETLADALGETLGPALQVSSGGYSVPMRRVPAPAPQMEAARAMAPPIEPGELDVNAVVSITYRLGT